jgi:MSHA biogenesis protein MshL
MTKQKWIYTLVSALYLSSCATFDASKDAEQSASTPISPLVAKTFDASGSGVLNSPKDDSVPDSKDILNSLLPSVTLGQPQKVQQPRFDVKADGLPLNQFLMGLVDGTSWNILVDPELTQPITLQLKNVTIDEVLAVLEQTQDIDVRQQGNIYYIGGSRVQTAVYPLDYLNLKRKGKSQTQVSSGQIQASTMAQGGQGGNNRSGGTSSSGGQNVSTLNSSKIETESETNLWQEVQKALEAIAAQDEKSFVMVSPQTGIVLVRARPMVQRQVAEYLGVAQANLGRQVMLEAKILEVRLNENFQAGVDWSKVHTNGAGNIIALGQLGQVLDVPAEANPINGVFNLLYQSDPNDPNADPFSAAIDLLEQQGNVQVLSSPRISTINNQKAVIKVGTDEFYVTDVSTTTTSGISSTTTPDVTLTPFFSGIALDVMPQVSANGDIILHVHPSVSEVIDQTKNIQIGDQDLSLPLALSSIRESDSIVKLKSGQVVVIGGLMQNQIVKNDSGVPVLSSIPLLGNLFKQQRDKVVKSELVLLLKATLVKGEEWQGHVDDAEQRFNRFNQP